MTYTYEYLRRDDMHIIRCELSFPTEREAAVAAVETLLDRDGYGYSSVWLVDLEEENRKLRQERELP